MFVNFATLAIFALVTNFTPGPATLTSASLGMRFGYKRTLPFILGMIVIYLTVMMLGALLSGALLTALPAVQDWLRVIGALYILYMAYRTLRASYELDADASAEPPGFAQGMLLNALNPKMMIYALTVYGTFLSGLSGKPLQGAVSALAMSLVGFTSASAWALAGGAIRTHLARPRFKRALNIVLALALVYTAVQLSGLLSLIAR